MSSNIQGSGLSRELAVIGTMPNGNVNNSKKPAGSQACYLVDRCPREVRDRIYRMFFRLKHAALPYESPTYDGMGYFKDGGRLSFIYPDNLEEYECPVDEMAPHEGFGLVTCCKKVSAEVCEILYEANYFVFRVNGHTNSSLGAFYNLHAAQYGENEDSGNNHEMIRQLYYNIFHRGIRQETLIFYNSTLPQFFRQIGIKNTSHIKKIGLQGYFILYQPGFKELLKGIIIMLKHLCPQLSCLSLDGNDMALAGPYRDVAGTELERIPYYVLKEAEETISEIFSMFAKGLPSLKEIRFSCPRIKSDPRNYNLHLPILEKGFEAVKKRSEKAEPPEIDDSSVIAMLQLEQEQEWLAPRVHLEE